MKTFLIIVSSIAAFQPIFCGNKEDIPVAAPVYPGELIDGNHDNAGSNVNGTPDQDAEAAEKTKSFRVGELVKKPLQAYGRASAALTCPYEAPDLIEQNFMAKIKLVRSIVELNIVCADMEKEFKEKNIPEEKSKNVREVCDNDKIKEQLAKKFSYPNNLPGRACPDKSDHRLTENGLTEPDGKRASNLSRGNHKCMRRIVQLMEQDQAESGGDVSASDTVNEEALRKSVEQKTNEVIIKATDLHEKFRTQGQTKLACRMSKFKASVKSAFKQAAANALVATGGLLYLLAIAMVLIAVLSDKSLNRIGYAVALGSLILVSKVSSPILEAGFKIGISARGTTPYIDYMNDVTKRAREQEQETIGDEHQSLDQVEDP